MEHSSLVAFLKGNLAPKDFASGIASEVNACELNLKSERIGSIILTDGPLEVVTRDYAHRLLQALLSDQLSFFAANYIANGLVMSDDFDFADEAVCAAIAFVADDSRPPTQEETEAAILALSQA